MSKKKAENRGQQWMSPVEQGVEDSHRGRYPGMPTLAVLKTETARHGLPDSDAEALYDEWLVNGFRTKNRLIKDWKAYLRNSIRHGWLPSLRKKPKEQSRRDSMLRQLKERGPQ